MISKKILISALSIIAMSAFGQACSPASQKDNSQSNLSSIPSLLEGDYIGASSQGDVYHSIIKLHVPQFGGDVFYHHISLKSLRGPSFQRKIYSFDESGRQMKSIVLLGESETFIDKKTMAESLSELPEENLLRFSEGCQFQWKRIDGGYVAEVHRERCSYESPAFGGLVSPEMNYTLSDCELVIKEGIFREDDSPIFPASTTTNRRANLDKAANKPAAC